jgi:hypothetical protein
VITIFKEMKKKTGKSSLGGLTPSRDIAYSYMANSKSGKER